MRLSKQKFSSNVVEKCLRQSSAHWRNIIIKELIAQPAISELLRDRYGEFLHFRNYGFCFSIGCQIFQY